ncbi:hypothetical protein WK68_20410 [Burkholderia ubonensis]|nr:hypothetical protein WK68_20410 [Burkholderia ubonensis]
MPGSDEIDASIARFSNALEVYRRNARTVAVWADVSWMRECIGGGADGDNLEFARLRAAVSALDDVQIAAVSRALLRSLDVGLPKLSALVGPSWSSLDAVPVEAGAQVLRMRALLFRRMELRRLIDRKSRMALEKWIGMQIDSIVGECSGGPDVDLLALTIRIPPLRALDAHALACEGLALLLRDLDVDRPPFTLLQLLFPRDLRLPEWPRQVDRALDERGSERLMAGLPEWFPEWGWVFG